MTLVINDTYKIHIKWMWGPVGEDSSVMLELEDDRKLSDISKDFEGVKKYERLSDTEGNMIFEGYTELLAIQRIYTRVGSKVQITLVKPLEE